MDVDASELLFGFEFAAGVLLDTLDFYYGQYMKDGQAIFLDFEKFCKQDLMSRSYTKDKNQVDWKKSEMKLTHEHIKEMLKSNFVPGYKIEEIKIEDKIGEIFSVKKVS